MVSAAGSRTGRAAPGAARLREESVRRAGEALFGAATSPTRLARALVAQTLAVTRGQRASVFDLRSGRWVRMATSEPGLRAMTLTLGTGEVPPGPFLVRDVSADPHPVSAVCRRLGYAAFALVPVDIGTGRPALIGTSSDVPGGLDFEDLSLLSMLAVTASTAARRTGEQTQDGSAVDTLAFQQRILECIARGEPLAETLRLVCVQVEAIYPGVRCSVLLAARDEGVLHHAAAPSLPKDFQHALDGLPIAPGMGACGSAAFSREPVVVADALEHPYTQRFRDLALAHDLRAVWSYPLLDAGGEVVGTFALYRDRRHRPDADELARVAALASIAGLAIERSITERALTRAGERDPLTGLPNRSLFTREVQAALDRSQVTSNPCAVLFLDLDGFKAVNDSLGHDAGDRVLVEVTGRLHSVLDGRSTLARFGGDEFTVLVENATSADVDALAHACHTTLSDPLVLDSGEFFLTTAIGVAVSGDGGQTPGDLVRDADIAMYAAKATGRGRTAAFDRALRERTVARLALETDLRAAIRNGGLDLHYQPVVDLRALAWRGAEALVRWTPPRRRAIPPAEFVPLAEETGVVALLGDLVLRAAAAQARAWEGSRLGGPVGINVSARQLTDPGLADDILRVLDEVGVPAGAIYVEVTESAVLADAELAVALLRQLRGAGIEVVIDDFGTGYSSIGRLRDLPVTGVKVDRTFVERLDREPESIRVVSAIVELAHALGLDVTAEGVETAGQLRLLEEVGCDRAQGFLLARPQPAEAVTALLAAGGPVVATAGR